MTTYDLEILIRTKKTGDDPSPPPDSGFKWTELKSKVDLAKQAFDQVAQVAKVAYGALKEGAELEAARGRFENLTSTINTTGDALLGKLREATKGMVSDAELIAGASDIISLGLAKNEGDTVRLATAVSTLGLDMQQVILTFANNSKARLDSLGLSVEEVTQKAAELQAQGFVGDAFDEAVLIGLEEKMALLGDASQTTAGQLQLVEAQLQNIKDGATSALARGLSPAIAGVSSTVTALNEGVAGGRSAWDNFKIVVGETGKALSGTETVWQGMIDTAKESDAQIQRQISHMARQAEEQARVTVAIEQAKAEQVAATQAIIDYSRAAAAAAGINEDLADKTAQLANQSGTATGIRQSEINMINAANAANQAYFDGIEQGRQALSAAFEASAEPVNELLAAQSDLAAAEGEWVTRTVSTAGQVSAINAQLAADLSNEQKNAYRDILNTVDEGSAEWLAAYNALQNDLTDSQRQALVAQQADLANQPDRLVDVYTGDSAAAEEAQARITAANEAIKQSYRETAAEVLLAQAAQNGNLEQTLETLVGIGYLTEAQAEARLEYANTTTAIETLAKSQEYARLTADEQVAALNFLIEGTAKTADEAVNLATQQTLVNDALNAMPKAVVSTVTVRGLDEAGSRVGDLLRQLDALDGRNVSATATVNTYTNEDLGSGGGGKEAPKKALGGPFAAGKLYRVGEGNLPEIGMIQSSGKLFMIPGERGQVFGNSQAGRMVGGGFNDYSQISIVNNNLEAAATTNALVQERRRASMDAYMGVE